MKLGSMLVGWLLAAVCHPALAGTLIINSNTSDPAPRAAWERAVEGFRAEHPDIQVKFNIYDHESYKKSIRNWLTSGSPDVVFWNVGNRMRQFVKPGLLEDVSELFTPAARAELGEAALDLVTVGSRQYGVPFSYYQIGFYYRRDLLEAAGMAEGPRSWEELLALCEGLKAQGIAAVAIGSKDLWPTAGWFDYLNLRLNGHDFHMALMDGEIAYTDPRIRAVFGKWRELLDRGCFVKNHASVSWQESQALLYQGKAALMLIGNFIVANFPPEMRDKMDFAPFPPIDPAMGRFEEAPMNSVHIPARARHKAEAKAFLAYVLRAEVQEAIAKATLTIPVNKAAAAADDRFLQKGQAHLAAAEGLSQYFDRDTSEDLATIAMKGFQEFMINPDRLDTVLETIERARIRIYRP